MRDQTRGYLAVVTAAALWGVSGVVAKSLFEEEIAPHVLIGIRLTGAAAVGLAYILVFRRHALLQAWQSRGAIVVLGIVLAFTQFAYYSAINLTDVATAIFLQYLAPMFLVLWARFVEAEPLTVARAGAGGFAVVGSYLLLVGPAGLAATPPGIAWGLASAVLFAIYTLLARRRVARADSWGTLVLALLSGAIVWSIVVPPHVAWLQPYTPSQWLLFAHLAVLATVLPFGLFLYSLRFISPSRAGLTATLEPVVAAFVAYLALGELLTVRQIAGGFLIVIAVAWTQLASERPSAFPAPD
jgi:drug/metabolite transporter (DMT)-like permease